MKNLIIFFAFTIFSSCSHYTKRSEARAPSSISTEENKIYRGHVFISEWTAYGYGRTMKYCDLSKVESLKNEALNSAAAKCEEFNESCDLSLVSYQVIPAPKYTRGINGKFTNFIGQDYAGCALEATLVGKRMRLPRSYSGVMFVNEWTGSGASRTMKDCNKGYADTLKNDAKNAALQECIADNNDCSTSRVTFEIIPSPEYTIRGDGSFAGCSLKATVTSMPLNLE